MNSSLILLIILNVPKQVLFSILNYLPEETRVSFIAVSKIHSKILTSDLSFKWRNDRLHIEYGVYYPMYSKNINWRQLFLANYKKKDLWTHEGQRDIPQDAPSRHNDTFQLNVSARFKPKGLELGTENRHEKKITLPLHQRLALIRTNENVKSQKQAFKILMEQGGWFSGEDENQDPNAASHADKHGPSISGGVHLIDTLQNAVVIADKTLGLRRFEFDKVFNEFSSQEKLYEETTMPLITEFINGFNATAIVYGQTGSGKTHTMFGPNVHEESYNDIITDNSGAFPESFGIVPRAIKEVFDAIGYRKKHLNLNVDIQVSVSYIEIYGDEISDLLKQGKSCGQSRVAAQRYVLDGSSEQSVYTLKETLILLDKGEKQKRKAATAMNSRSSRAHTLFIVTLSQECLDTGIASTSRLFLVDLGGSEQIKRSQPSSHGGDTAVNEDEDKLRVNEAVNINLGLLALKQCVEALRNGKHVPYKDSKLTMMLSTGLGGDSKTSVILCGAQEASHGPETIAAMKFGQTCRGIYNTVKTNANMLAGLLRQIENNIASCEEQIRENERWEEVDQEIIDDDGNLIDVRRKYVVTGADEYRQQLANLIRQKAELTGESVDELFGAASSTVQAFGNFHDYTSIS